MDQDQSLEFPFEAPTPPHEEEVPTTSLELDDVIKRICYAARVASTPSGVPQRERAKFFDQEGCY